MRYEGEFRNGQMGGGIGTVFNADGTIHMRNAGAENQEHLKNVTKEAAGKLSNLTKRKRPKNMIQTIGNLFKTIWPFGN